MAQSAILSIRIVANARDAARGLRQAQRDVRQFGRDIDTLSGGASGAFMRMGASIAKVTALTFAATAAVAPLVGVVGSLGIGMAGLGAVAAPALAAVALGFEGIKNAAKTITPQFDAIKSAVSSTFEQGLTPAFEKLGGLLEHITPAMQGIAEAVSGAFSGMVDTITGPGRAALDQLLAGGKAFVETMTPGLQRMTQGLLDFGATAASQAGVMGTAFGGVLATIGDALGRVPESLFTGFAKALDGLSALLGPLVDLFSELGVIIGPVVGELFKSLGQAIQGMIPGLSVVAGNVGKALVQIFQTLAPVLPQLATAFGTLTTALLPLIQPLADFIAKVGVDLANMIVQAAPFIEQLATLLGDVLGFLEPMIPILLPLAGFIFGVVEAIKAWTLVQGALNLVLAANPVVLIVLAVLALIAAVIWAYQNVDWFRDAVDKACGFAKEAFQWVVEKVKEVWHWIQDNLIPIVVAAWQKFIEFKDRCVEVFNAVKDRIQPIKDAIQGVIDFVGRLIDKIRGIRFPSPPSWLTSLFSAGGAFTFMPPEITRFLPEGYQQFAAAPAELTAAASNPFGSTPFGSGGMTTHVTNVNIRVDGALDPVAVADQIKGLLRTNDRTVGLTAARTV